MTSLTLTPCQAKALHLLVGDENVFLTGAAGTGKSELLRQYLRGKGRTDYPILASTGAAAMIVDGRTFHSFFGLGIMEGGREATVVRALRNRQVRRRLNRAKCIVIDEVSMLSGEVLATAEEIARCAREDIVPWGGLRVIAVGDFAQLPPVQPQGEAKDWAFLHPIWQTTCFQSAYLDTPIRTKDDRLLRVLDSVREGKVTDEVYTFLTERTTPADPLFEGTILFPHRTSTDAYNMNRLQRISGQLHQFATVYEGNNRFIEQLQKQCPIPPVLRLKIGALVMLRKNDASYPYAYVNGSLGIVHTIEDDVLHIELLCGQQIEIEKQTFSLLDGNGTERASAENFPITLAWAMTIHKAQGASIDRLMVSMSRLWESGHAYVALSRARSESGLFVEDWDASSIFVDPEVQSFYEQVRCEWELCAADLPAEPPLLQQHTPKPKKTPSYKKTRDLLKAQQTLPEIAAVLGFKEETILNHIEKLIREDSAPDIDYLKPDAPTLEIISTAFEKHGLEFLKPVRDALDRKYSYQELRLARLSLLQNRQKVSK